MQIKSCVVEKCLNKAIIIQNINITLYRMCRHNIITRLMTFDMQKPRLYGSLGTLREN